MNIYKFLCVEYYFWCELCLYLYNNSSATILLWNSTNFYFSLLPFHLFNEFYHLFNSPSFNNLYPLVLSFNILLFVLSIQIITHCFSIKFHSNSSLNLLTKGKGQTFTSIYIYHPSFKYSKYFFTAYNYPKYSIFPLNKPKGLFSFKIESLTIMTLNFYNLFIHTYGYL